MSVLFYDSDSIEKSFDKLKQAVNDIENKVNNEINNLKSQLEIKPNSMVAEQEPDLYKDFRVILENLE